MQCKTARNRGTGQGIIQEFNLGVGSHVSITLRQIFWLLP